MARVVSDTSSSKKRKYANGATDTKYKGKRVQRTAATSITTKKLLFTSTNTSHPGVHAMHTRGITRTITRDVVFNTTELLEKILSHLSPADVLTVRQINSHWYDLITNSPGLTYKLCTAQQRTIYFWACDLNTAVVSKHKIANLKALGDQWRAERNIFVPAQINTLLFEEKTIAQKQSFLHRAVYCEAFRFAHPPDLGIKDSMVLGMFVCQPPTESVVTEFFYGSKPATGSRRKFKHEGYLKRRVHSKAGVKLGDVVRDFIEALGPTHVLDKGRILAINVDETRMWVRRMVFPSDEEWEMVDHGLHAPTKEEVREFKWHVARVGGT